MKNNKNITYFVISLIILIGIGFLGYYFGFLRFIYNVMIPEAFSQYSLVALSAIFGIAAFFSPCAFTILPAYVSNYLGKKGENRLKSSLYLGIMAALGVITVNMIIGLFIAFLGSAIPFAKDPRQDIPIILGIRILAGLFIAILGLTMLIGRQPNLHFIQKFFSRLPRNMYTQGMIFNAATIGCTGPILLGLILYSFASGSFVKAITAFAIFSLTMGVLMIVITMLTGLLKNTIIRRLSGIMPFVNKTVAIVMVIVGLSIVILTLEGNNLFVKIFFPYLR